MVQTMIRRSSMHGLLAFRSFIQWRYILRNQMLIETNSTQIRKWCMHKLFSRKEYNQTIQINYNFESIT